MAKLQRAPPPPARPQANDDNSRPNGLDKSLPSLPQRMNHAPPRPASRMDAARSQDDLSRPMNMGYHNATKAPPKRPYQQDAGDEMASRPTMQRSGPSYQQNEGKRRRTGEDHQELDVPEGQPRLMAPPIRQSSIRPKVNHQSPRELESSRANMRSGWTCKGFVFQRLCSSTTSVPCWSITS